MQRIKKLLVTNNYVTNKCFVGKTGTGKTTQILNELNREKLKNIIYLYTGKSQIIKENKKIFSMIYIFDFLNVIQDYNPDNKIFIFDDMKYYISINQNERNTKKINEFLGRSRHNNNTFYFSFHGFDQIPSFLYTFFNEIIIFKTANKKKLDIPYINELEPVINEVNRSKELHYFKRVKV